MGVNAVDITAIFAGLASCITAASVVIRALREKPLSPDSSAAAGAVAG